MGCGLAAVAELDLDLEIRFPIFFYFHSMSSSQHGMHVWIGTKYKMNSGFGFVVGV